MRLDLPIPGTPTTLTSLLSSLAILCTKLKRSDSRPSKFCGVAGKLTKSGLSVKSHKVPSCGNLNGSQKC